MSTTIAIINRHLMMMLMISTLCLSSGCSPSTVSSLPAAADVRELTVDLTHSATNEERIPTFIARGDSALLVLDALASHTIASDPKKWPVIGTISINSTDAGNKRVLLFLAKGDVYYRVNGDSEYYLIGEVVAFKAALRDAYNATLEQTSLEASN